MRKNEDAENDERQTRYIRVAPRNELSDAPENPICALFRIGHDYVPPSHIRELQVPEGEPDQTEMGAGLRHPEPKYEDEPDQEFVVSAWVLVRANCVKRVAESEETEQRNVQAGYVEVAEGNAIEDLERYTVCC